MKLNELSDNQGATHSRMRVGRGIGSGKGKTGGRGVKGQKSRSGVAIKGYEGGQMTIYRRLPKRGFTNIFAKKLNVVSLARIQTAIDAGKMDAKKTVDMSALIEAGIIRRPLDGFRVLSDGEITAKVSILANGISRAALEKVEKAGGKFEAIVIAAPAEDKE